MQKSPEMQQDWAGYNLWVFVYLWLWILKMSQNDLSTAEPTDFITGGP